jgi:putative NADH-flavin reductase
MRLALLGASGRIGNEVLAAALAAGHEVTALVRNPASLASATGLASTTSLAVIAGDATDASAVAEAVTGADAVLSALGPRGAKTPALLASAGSAIVAAMGKTGTRRLICVSAAGAFIQGDPSTGAVIKFILPRVLAKTFADVRAMEAVVSASDLDWTLVRPVRLINAPPTGRYRVRPDFPPPGGRKIARGDVARFMAAALTDNSWLRARPALAY